MRKPFEQTSSPENDAELKALLDEHALIMSPRIEAALAEKDASLAEALTLASEQTTPTPEATVASEVAPEPATAVPGDAVHSRSPLSVPAKGIDEQKIKAVRRRKDPRSSRKTTPPSASADASVPTDTAESTMNAPQESAPAQVEAEPLAEGKYRDAEGQLLQVFKQGEEYWYKLLEGENEGQLLQMSGDESASWQKVDDTTEPALGNVDVTTQEEGQAVSSATGASSENRAGEEEKWAGSLPDKMNQQVSFVGKEGPIVVERTADGYRLTTQTGEPIGEGYDEEHIRNIAREESWKLLDDIPVLSDVIEQKQPVRKTGLPAGLKEEDLPVLNDEVVPTPEKKNKEQSGGAFRTLKDGETAWYVAPDQKVYGIVQEKGGYKFTEGAVFRTHTEEEMRAIVARGGWTLRTVEKPETILADGETARYFVPELQAEYTLTRTAEGYTFTDGKKYKSPAYTEAEIAEIIRTAGWQRVEKRVPAKSQEKKHVGEEYQELFEGDIWVLRNEAGEVTNRREISLLEGSGDHKFADVERDDNGRLSDMGSVYLEQLRQELISAGYVRTNKGTKSEKILDQEAVTTTHKERESDDFLEYPQTHYLSEGGSVENGTWHTVEERSSGYYLLNGDDWEGPLTKEALEKRMADENWVEQEAPQEGEKSVFAMETEMAEVPKAEQESSEQKIEDLRALVDMQRLEYVSVDYKQNSAWMKVKRFFGKSIGDQPGDADTESKRQSYELALMKLQEAELAELKKGNFSEAELREKMAGMLNFYKYEERINLFKTRDEVKMETMNVGHLVITALETAGRSYNKLPRSAKYAIGALCIATAAAGGSVGGGVAAAALGMASVRKALAAAGLAVTADTYLEGRAEKKKETAVKEEQTADMKTLKESQEAGEDHFAKLDALLKKDIGGLDAKFKAQKREALLRRSAAWGMSVGSVLGGSFLASHWQDIKGMFSHSPIGKLAGGLDALKAAESAPRVGSGVVSGAVSPETVTPSPEVVSGAGLLQGYEVSKGDTVWGILKDHLPKGMSDSDANRAVKLLENTLREKLEGKSPAELKALGFGPKGLDDIRPGSTLPFDKLLTKEEIQSALAGKSLATGAAQEVIEGHAKEVPVTAPEAPKVSGEVSFDRNTGGEPTIQATTPSRTPLDEALFENRIAQAQATPMVPLDQAMPDATEPVRQAVLEDQANFAKLSNPQELRAFLAQNPDRVPLPEFTRTLGVMRRDIFLTPELVDYNPFTAQFDYTTHPNMGQVNMARALEGARNLRTGVWQEYTLNRSGYPLHSTQIRSLERLVVVAQDPQVFGSLGLPQAHETIDQYTRRIAAMTVAWHKERPLALLMQRGNSLV